MIGFQNTVTTLLRSAVIASAALVGLDAVAEVPETIAYQGVLRDSGGVPISGTANLTFRIFDVDSGGTALWTETHSSVPVTNGAFAVKLGSVTPFRNQADRNPDVLNSDNLRFDRPYWLSIQVNADPEMAPRLDLTTVPYAFSGAAITETIVDCTGGVGAEDSIQALLDSHGTTPSAAAGALLVININGICEQNVHIKRDGVILRGVNLDNGGAVLDPPVHGITGQVSGTAAVRIDGATNVVVQNLIIASKTGAGLDQDRGLWVRANGAVYVSDSKFQDSLYGVFAQHGGFVEIDDSTIDARVYGALFADAGHGQLKNSDITVPSGSTKIPLVTGANTSHVALALYRKNNVRLQGANTVTITGGGKAIEVYHSAALRQDAGHTVVNGDVSVGNLSMASLREPEVIGSLIADNNSLIELRNNKLTGANPELTAVDVRARNKSSIIFPRDNMNLTATGDVEASTSSAVDVARSTIVATFGNLEAEDNSTIVLGGTITVTGDASISDDSSLEIEESPDPGESGPAPIKIAGKLDLWNSGNVEVYGPLAWLEVSGSSNGSGARVNVGDGATLDFLGGLGLGQGSKIDVGENSELIVEGGTLNLGDNSHMFANDNATVEGDITFFNFTLVNFFGTGVTYNGNMNFGQGLFVGFGVNPTITGSINCNGNGIVNVANSGDLSGTTVTGCTQNVTAQDLAIQIVESGDPVSVGSGMNFSVQVDALDTLGTSNNVTVQFDLSGVTATFTSALLDGVPCDASGFPMISCDGGLMNGGEQKLGTISFTPTSAGTLTATATVSSDQNDSNPSNNTAVETTSIIPPS